MTTVYKVLENTGMENEHIAFETESKKDARDFVKNNYDELELDSMFVEIACYNDDMFSHYIDF